MVNEQFVLEANPKKPWKMYAAVASAFLSSLLLTDIGLPAWAKAIITAVIAALAVFLVPNPLRVKPADQIVKKGPSANEDDPYLWE